MLLSVDSQLLERECQHPQMLRDSGYCLPTGAETICAGLDMCRMSAGEVTAIDCLMDDGSQSPFPVLQCRNVYVLPGVPHLLRKKWLVSLDHKW